MNGVFYRIGYFFTEAWKNVRHSPLLSVIAVLTIAVSLVLVGFFGGLLFGASKLVDRLAGDIRVAATLEREFAADDRNVAALETALRARPGVTAVEYVSVEEDLARNRTLLSDDLLEGLDERSIPADPTLEVVLEKHRRLRRDLPELASWLRKQPGVTGVTDVEVGLDQIRLGIAFVDVFRGLAWIVCGVLLVAAVFFVFSTVKLAVHARADEIEILRLVGATPRFIRVPFYIEGIVQGLLGSGIAFGVVLFVHTRLNAQIREQHLLDVPLDLIPWTLVVWFFAGGVLLGFLGSVFSVGRYLRG